MSNANWNPTIYFYSFIPALALTHRPVHRSVSLIISYAQIYASNIKLTSSTLVFKYNSSPTLAS